MILKNSIICIVIFMISFPVYTAELGRLFISENERSKINLMRKKELYEDRIKKSEVNNEKKNKVEALVKNVPEKSVEPENNFVTMNGFIRRENGEVTVWINGVTAGKGLSENIYIQNKLDEKNQVILKSNKKIKRLKVGQKWDYKTDEIYDSY